MGERTGQGGYGHGIYVPNDPDEYDQIYTGEPSQYIDPHAVVGAPFNPNASPLDPRQMPYMPAPPPDLTLDEQKTLRG